MKDQLVIPWPRYGLIAELAHRLDGLSPQFGKTVLQKMVFLLQELHDIDCGYDFTLYTYGPFASLLLQDLDLAESLKGVDVHPAEGVAGGYTIKPGEANSWLRAKAGGFLKVG